MARYLHLVGGDADPLAQAVIARPAAGDEITVVLVDGDTPASLPPGTRLLRLGDGLDYAGLLDLIFEADHVISW